MLFREDVLRGIGEGRVTLAFRRWRRAPPVAGSTLRTPIGVLAFDRVSVVEAEDITPADVSRTGMSADVLRASIAGEGALLRVELRLLGDDPRTVLREQRPSPEEIATILARLRRFDAAADAPWTVSYLRLIAGQPATVARVLAAHAGAELIVFKRRVRQLKELGLTESLEVGYRISPRGRVVLDHIARDPR